jgi:probable F420-dependent oxidoreductase
VKFGISFSGVSPRHYPGLAVQAERAGFESVWIPDHLVFPEVMPPTYLYTEDGRPPIPSTTAVYDPWVLLGTIAAVTDTIRFGTSVYVLPLRHPIVTARSVLTVDRVSRGRVTLGAGVGWLKEEFEILGQDATTRGRRTDEIIPLLRRLWSEPVIEHHGKYYDIPPVYFEPKPFQKPIPIEIGGTSPPALRRAGALGDGWIEIGTSDRDELATMLTTVLAARTAAGRDHLPFTVTAANAVGDSLDYVARMADVGVDRVVLRVPAPAQPLSRSELDDVVERFAASVITPGS